MQALKPAEIAPLLERRRDTKPGEPIPVIALDRMLSDILAKANEFVPSESGSILIDDPRQKKAGVAGKDLIFACCFGSRASDLIGQRISSDRGIVGKVYQGGAAMLTNEASSVPNFDAEYDKKLGHKSLSLLCVPIRIGNSICGVIELVNKLDGESYNDTEKELLEIFAGYISSAFQNILDARKIEKMVRIDNLSGLYNDRCLHERLKEEVKSHAVSGKPFSIIFLDLDHFKGINDQHGHLAGSATLAEYGDVLREAVTHPGATLARYGGDEFSLLLPSCNLARATEIGETIRANTQKRIFLSAPWGTGNAPLNLGNRITASVGVSTWSPSVKVPARDQEGLITKLLSFVDKLMYDSKAKGKNCVTAAALPE